MSYPLPTKNTLASFTGGPLHGQSIVIYGEPDVYELHSTPAVDVGSVSEFDAVLIVTSIYRRGNAIGDGCYNYYFCPEGDELL